MKFTLYSDVCGHSDTLLWGAGCVCVWGGGQDDLSFIQRPPVSRLSTAIVRNSSQKPLEEQGSELRFPGFCEAQTRHCCDPGLFAIMLDCETGLMFER